MEKIYYGARNFKGPKLYSLKHEIILDTKFYYHVKLFSLKIMLLNHGNISQKLSTLMQRSTRRVKEDLVACCCSEIIVPKRRGHKAHCSRTKALTY